MSNKWILILVATGLWANAVVAFIKPVQADAANDLSAMVYHLDSIEHDIHSIYNGNCPNTRLC